MAVFDFLKKKEMMTPLPPGQSTPSVPQTPVDYVRNMRSQGYADVQIIEALRQQNYPETMIMDAMNQAEVKGPAQEQQSQPALMQQWQPKEEPDKESFEAIAEAIVDEKWKEIKTLLDKRKEWEEMTNNDLVKLKQEVADARNDLNNLHKAIVSKISDYDQNLLSVGTEIKAMEKVFQKILPDLTQSVNELSRLSEVKRK